MPIRNVLDTSGFHHHAWGQDNLVQVVLSTIEELLEFSGVILFLEVLLRLRATRASTSDSHRPVLRWRSDSRA